MPADRPSSIILGYIAAADTPSRARSVTANTMLILGILYALLSLVLAVITYLMISATGLRNEWSYIIGGSVPSYYYGYHPVPSRWEAFMNLLEFVASFTPAFIALGAAVLGVLAFIISPPIRRGKRRACFTGMFVVAFTLIVMIIVGVSTGAAGAMAIVPIGGSRVEPSSHLFWFIPTLLIIILAALCIDLLGYLRWVAAQPAGEKPVKKFL